MTEVQPWDYEEHKIYLEQMVANEERYLRRLKERLEKWIKDNEGRTVPSDD